MKRVSERAAQFLGSPLDPWQKVLVRYLTAPTREGRPWPAEAAAVVARQNGKSYAMMALVLDRLLEGWRIVGTAQRINLARDQWMTLAALFDPKVHPDPPLVGLFHKSDKSRGNERLELTNGGLYRVVAANDQAARGIDNIQMWWADEARELKSWAVWGAIEPVTTVAENSQIVLTSNAGTEESVVLNAFRDRGRLTAAKATPDDPIVWLEWSADPGRDIDDPDGWAEANPNMGHRFPPEKLANTYRTLADAPDDFRTERLCQWVTAMGAAIDIRVWRDLGSADLPPPEPGGQVFMALGVDPHRRGAVIMLGHQTDGRTHLGVLRAWELEAGQEVSDLDVANALVEEYDKWRPTRIAYNSYVAAAVEHLTSRRRLPLLDMKGRRYFDSCAVLHEQVKTGRVRHDADPLLDLHISTAVREDMRDQTGWFLSRRRSPGPIYAADAAAMLTWLVTQRPGARPQVVTLTG